MTDAKKCEALALAAEQVSASQLARAIKADRGWKSWKLGNVRRRLRDWVDPDRAHNFPLMAYEAWLEEVGFDPLAEVHAAAVERGTRRREESRVRELEREIQELKADMPRVRTVRERGAPLRQVG